MAVIFAVGLRIARMDELAAAAQAAVPADEGANPSPDDDHDPQRGDLPSDDEEGPGDPDEDDDSMPPGDVDACGLPVDEPDDGAALGDPAVGAAGGGTPTEQAAAGAPELPPTLGTLKVEELKEHLRWRGLALAGNKAALLERLSEDSLK